MRLLFLHPPTYPPTHPPTLPNSYSDILYVKESRAELSHLAHLAAQNDKYRPETCCIIGNYYSLKGQHERAVMYFQRALKLNRKFLFAWTLMGHGFLEMKNTGAAIEVKPKREKERERENCFFPLHPPTHPLLEFSSSFQPPHSPLSCKHPPTHPP